jgi:hypothetical protein
MAANKSKSLTEKNSGPEKTVDSTVDITRVHCWGWGLGESL